MLSNSHARRASKRHPLAACIAGLFALSAPLATWAVSTTWTVTNCTDDAALGNASNHIGSLRFVVANAASGDTIDLTKIQMQCSTISLQNGAIAISQDDLTLNGPGRDALTITGKDSPQPDRIFTHTGAGTLYLSNLSVSYGYVKDPANQGQANGGCIYSNIAGSVVLNGVSVQHCKASAPSGDASGGGIFTAGPLTLAHSNVSFNVASGGPGGRSFGGGIYASGGFLSKYSVIRGNASALDVGNSNYCRGGGLNAFSNKAVTIINSEISENLSSCLNGGAVISSSTAYISNSTISGNSAMRSVGGLQITTGALSVISSTISFNTEGKDNCNYQAGVAARGCRHTFQTFRRWQ